MTQVYFHCSNTKKVFLDHRGAVVDDLVEARDHATRVVQSFTNERSFEDWRDWVLHVSDGQGDELFRSALHFRARQAALTLYRSTSVCLRHCVRIRHDLLRFGLLHSH